MIKAPMPKQRTASPDGGLMVFDQVQAATLRASDVSSSALQNSAPFASESLAITEGASALPLVEGVAPKATGEALPVLQVIDLSSPVHSPQLLPQQHAAEVRHDSAVAAEATAVTAQLQHRLAAAEAAIIAASVAHKQLTDAIDARLARAENSTANSLIQAANEIHSERAAAQHWRKTADAAMAESQRLVAQLQSSTLSHQTAVNDALRERGLTIAEQPRVTLRQGWQRRIAEPAAAVGSDVVIYYSPRGGDGSGQHDDSEFRVAPTQERKVWCGYTVDVPDGYVCDVTVAGEVVASRTGHGEGELVVPVRGHGGYRHVRAGQELCRLSLRRCVVVGVVVEVERR